MGLDRLFSPQAVAVVGASSRELTIGYRIIENLLAFGFRGPIYPVNPKGGVIHGLKVYSSILDLPGPVDVAHVVIKNTLVPACVEQCAAAGVQAVIVNTAGFREIGGQGAELENQLAAIVRRTGVRVFGPNCQGIINTDPAVRAYCNFTFTRPQAGHISIVAQSGGVGEVIHQRITELEGGVRLYASNGNACDVSIPEIIEHYGRDDPTQVIVVHIESLSDPRAFLEAAGRVALRKPILGMKAGRTTEGVRAVASHTGGMMTQEKAIELVFEKAGVLGFRSLEQLCQSAIGFAAQPVPAGNRVGMIANTGGPAIIATDELIEGGMVMPPLSERTRAVLRDKLYPEASINNPVDVLATAGPEHFAAALDALLDDDSIDALLLNFITPFFVDTVGVARAIAAANARSRKPMLATVMTEKKGWAQMLGVIHEGGVPTFDMPETGARVLASMGRYAALLERRADAQPPVTFSDADTSRARLIIAGAVEGRRERLSADEAYALLACYRIPFPRYGTADSLADCLKVAGQIGYPVVLKLEADEVLHKTERAAVALNIPDPPSLREHAEHMAARFAEMSPRFLVQEQVCGGREVIIGAVAAEGLGHVLMFGLGGIYVELVNDASFKLAPVTQREAREMIESLRGRALLTGARGQAGVDIGALTEMLLRVSQMLQENPEIRELDINPLFALHQGVRAADVRVLLAVESS